jgi:all-trans-retinol dehydrogenase (NAD+)
MSMNACSAAEDVLTIAIPYSVLKLVGMFLGLFLASAYKYTFMKPKQDLTGKLALVTGAAGGVGRLLVEEFAQKGCNVVLWDINEKVLKDVENQMAAKFPNSKFYSAACDISKREKVYEAADLVRKTAGDVDILVNNAGIVSGSYLMDLPDAKIVKSFEINALAHYWTIKAFMPKMMEKNSGHIVAVSSGAGLFGSPKLVDYSGTKYAVAGLMDALRAELNKLGKSGVGCTTVHPGHIKTALFKGYKTNPLLPSLEPQYVAEQIVRCVQEKQPMLCMPAAMYNGVAVKGLVPVYLNDWIQDVTGVSGAMDHFDDTKANSDFKLSGVKH